MNLSERYEKKLNGTQTGGHDGILLQMELTNACSHACVFCPNRASTRKRTMMETDFARRMIDEADGFLGSGRQICFHMNGEPLLHRDIVPLVAYAKEKHFGYAFVTTNGSAASDGLLAALFDAGLDSIKFSINAGTRETYRRVHGRDDFDKAVHALKFASEYRRRNGMGYRIFVSCVGFTENAGELETLQELAEPYCDEVVFYYPCGYAGADNALARTLRCDLSGHAIKSFEIRHNAPCAVLWNSINVTCEGYLSLCCSESDNRLIVEDLHDMSLREAWAGRRMEEIRRRHREGRIESLPCRACVNGGAVDDAAIDGELFALSIEKRRRQHV